MYIDLVGQVFGRLTVIGIARADAQGRRSYYCLCTCGAIKAVRIDHLRRKRCSSCGCYRVDTARTLNTIHGATDSRLYSIWCNMKRRCGNSHATGFQYWGGKGVTVCDEWRRSFAEFQTWALANGYTDSLTLNRIDNSKGYSPDNCRWANRTVQSRNRNNKTKYVPNSKTMLPMSVLAEEAGIPYKTFMARLASGWDLQRAMTTPLRRRN